MGEAVLNSFCRLCLRETISLSNIFSSQSPSGELIYDVLNYVYDLKICPDDGLPPLICAPCSWKMHEFNSYKMNVHFAKEEIVKLLDEIRPDSVGDSENIDTQFVSDTNPPVNVKDEIEIEEWQMPEELKRPMDSEGDGSESVLHAHGNIVNIHHEPASSEETSQGIVIELKQEELIIEEEEAIQTPGSSDLTNILSLEASEGTVGSLFEGEGICTTQGISVEIRDANKGINEEDLRDVIVPVEESLSSEMSKSILDVRKSGRSHFKASLSKRKRGFICDICKKNCTTKQNLGVHVRVHYDERPFNCRKCDKTFKYENVRNRHELIHLRDEINSGKSETETKNGLYSCDLCSKNFSSRYRLWSHSNLHSNKYKCNTCGKCFGLNIDLRRHLRTHTKEKPFKCDFCLKYFAHKSNLNEHLRIHSSERLYVCGICDKRFKNKQQKNQHALYHLRKK